VTASAGALTWEVIVVSATTRRGRYAMSSQPFPPGAAVAADAAPKAINLLETAQRVADQTRAEAQEEAQRLLEAARVQADQIRAEARADTPKLQAATSQLRVEHRRVLDALEALRGTLGTALEQQRRAFGIENQADSSPETREGDTAGGADR
jgi:cell division septum initiation protein DivIVA